VRLADIYAAAKDPVISFEVFPPRTEAGERSLAEALPRLRALNPRFMTCTYGAGGSTRDKTLEVATHILRELKVDAACHLTCVGSSRAELRELLGRICDAGIENVVALRGDPPAGESEFRPAPDGLSHANELVSFIRADSRASGLGLAVAGYPETHTEAPSPEADLENLKRKVNSGADVVITQLFFENRDFLGFRERARSAGITVPIVPGLMPVQSTKQIHRIAAMCGASIPEALRSRLAEAGDDPEAVKEVGADYCLEQARELLGAGVPGIHFYVLNAARVMTRVMAGLGI
jgi:methylenetetrahydrofolate reductase (NADPH)